MEHKAIVINTEDNVANMIGPGNKGLQIKCNVADSSIETVKLLDDVPSNHKFAFRDMKKGEPVIKYGLNIGKASKNISKGQYVHVHNIESNRGRGDLAEK
jgi:altronate dehydratase small subunit